jgi:hypothetical protein
VEKRKYSRVQFETEVKLITLDSVYTSCRARDIGLGGAFIYLSESPPQGTHCLLEFSLIGPASLLKIEAQAEVIRVEPEGVGVEFTKIDVDGLIHLRHLIRIQSDNPELIDEEYSSTLLDLD